MKNPRRLESELKLGAVDTEGDDDHKGSETSVGDPKKKRFTANNPHDTERVPLL